MTKPPNQREHLGVVRGATAAALLEKKKRDRAERARQRLLRPPRALDQVAREEWQRSAPELARIGVLTPKTKGLVAARCAAYSLVVRSTIATNRHGLVKTVGGIPRARFATRTAAAASMIVLELSRYLGLTPRSRAMRKD